MSKHRAFTTVRISTSLYRELDMLRSALERHARETRSFAPSSIGEVIAYCVSAAGREIHERGFTVEPTPPNK